MICTKLIITLKHNIYTHQEWWSRIKSAWRGVLLQINYAASYSYKVTALTFVLIALYYCMGVEVQVVHQDFLAVTKIFIIGIHSDWNDCRVASCTYHMLFVMEIDFMMYSCT